jgi:hypothetical protein
MIPNASLHFPFHVLHLKPTNVMHAKSPQIHAMQIPVPCLHPCYLPLTQGTAIADLISCVPHVSHIFLIISIPFPVPVPIPMRMSMSISFPPSTFHQFHITPIHQAILFPLELTLALLAYVALALTLS